MSSFWVNHRQETFFSKHSVAWVRGGSADFGKVYLSGLCWSDDKTAKIFSIKVIGESEGKEIRAEASFSRVNQGNFVVFLQVSFI